MKKILLLLIFSSILTFDCLACGNVKIDIVRQRKVEGLSDNPFANREVEFRISNTSNCKIFIKGSQGQSFFPEGLFMRFDQKRRKWVSSLDTGLTPEFKDLGVSEPDEFLMLPNETFVFTDLLEDSAFKRQYKRIIYVSFETEKSEPKAIESPAFWLNRN